MFTGLIQEIATVKEINSHHGDIQAVFSIDEKQSFLEMTDAVERVKTLSSKIEKEIESIKTTFIRIQ